jgi:hypothetical protein
MEREQTRNCKLILKGFVERNIKHYNMKSKQLSSTIIRSYVFSPIVTVS